VTTQIASQQPYIPTITPPRLVHIPGYLRDYLDGLTAPKTVNMSYLLDVGQGALTAKIAHIESFNSGVAARLRKRLPDKLDFSEVAIIMTSLFVFKNIKMSKRSEDTLLGVYIADGEHRKGTYDTDQRRMHRLMEPIAPDFKKKDMNDVLDKIERIVPVVEQTKDKHLFIVNNGMYNQATDTLHPFHPDYIYLTKIPINYVDQPTCPVITAPDGYKWDVESWIHDLADNDDDTATLIWQVIADCLQPHYSRKKSIWFYSEKGNNGKGTVGQLIKNLLGPGNYASLSVAEFKHEFLKETLIGVAANIADENDVEMFIDSIKDYKASVTGDDVIINRKYLTPIRLQFLGANIQMMNGLPKTKDKSDSFYRRLILVPFLRSFTNNGERGYIKDDYIHRQPVLEYVLYKVLHMDFDEYIVPEKSSVLMDSYREKNNPVLEFWNELKDRFKWQLIPTQFAYDLFISWFDINNPSGKPPSKRTFIDTLNAVVNASDDEWEVKNGQNDKVRSQGRMDDDEPLITEFGLDQPLKGNKPSPWVNPNFNGTNKQDIRNFPRRPTYRGYVRT